VEQEYGIQTLKEEINENLRDCQHIQDKWIRWLKNAKIDPSSKK
jgi:hypothetical protein